MKRLRVRGTGYHYPSTTSKTARRANEASHYFCRTSCFGWGALPGRTRLFPHSPALDLPATSGNKVMETGYMPLGGVTWDNDIIFAGGFMEELRKRRQHHITSAERQQHPSLLHHCHVCFPEHHAYALKQRQPPCFPRGPRSAPAPRRRCRGHGSPLGRLLPSTMERSCAPRRRFGQAPQWVTRSPATFRRRTASRFSS